MRIAYLHAIRGCHLLMSQGTATDSGGYFPSSLALTINDQPVENRRQLVGAKAPRRSTEDSPQSTGCLPADALRQGQRATGRGTEAQLKYQKLKKHVLSEVEWACPELAEARSLQIRTNIFYQKKVDCHVVFLINQKDYELFFCPIH